MLSAIGDIPLKLMNLMEMMPAPHAIHVYHSSIELLPYQTATINALFYIKSNQDANTAEFFPEVYRILKPGGLFFVKGEASHDELERAGFMIADNSHRDLEQILPNWRAAYVSEQNGRLLVTELEKSNIFPLKSPYFKTALCAIKPPITNTQ